MLDILSSLRLLWKVATNRDQLRPVLEKHLFFLDIRKYSVWGSISEQDEAGIAKAVSRASHYDGPIVEIGILFGHTTQMIASLKQKDKALIGVENFTWNPFELPPEDHRIITRRTLRYCMDHASTSIFEGANTEFYKSYSGPRPSMVFIDADHTYEGVMIDIEWARRTKIPVICGHDYSPLCPSVIKAVDKTFGESIEVIGSVWIGSGLDRQ